MNHVYGIPNCTTVRKARKFMEAEGHEHAFTAFAKADDLPTLIRGWVERAGLETVLNARSATFQALDDVDKERAVADSAHAIALMSADPRLIKRPVLDTGAAVLTGFDEAAWRATL
ncbi:ArsC/Spx/MgsR family protein [Pontivivens insulae]|uniref:Regulatory protein Spx n=1 Tax=Pontivivens insulae TaxID=1639689 RepID=A0A2R8AAG2_9RHOB|nr:ArsC/Spx/MgsR family protein [Pontivivens insulae]RED13107.1 Spx/MgsR family transcriptional regulator [Pontivivens insulae]SPF29199.1 Regulatory protein Spx [Pontivivens insulae]